MAAVKASDAGALRPAAPELPAVPGMLTPLPLPEVELAAAADAERDAEADAAALVSTALETGVKSAEDVKAGRVSEVALASDAVLALKVGVAVAESDAEPASTCKRCWTYCIRKI